MAKEQINSQYFAFTWNNYTEDNVAELLKLTENQIEVLVFGREVGQEGTPHLQGYVMTQKKHRLTGIKKLLDPKAGSKSKIHIEMSKPAMSKKGIEYCKKGEQSKEEWVAQDVSGPNYGKNALVHIIDFRKEGKVKQRNFGEELAIKVKKCITECNTMKEVAKDYGDLAVKHYNNIEKMLNDKKEDENTKKLKEKISKLTMKPWQARILEELKQEPDDRKIIWIYDAKGGAGKTTFAKMLLMNGDCAYLSNAKTSDIAYAYHGERVAIFDFSRSNEDKINYGAIESVKNGIMFSGKYESKTKLHPQCPHLICMANFKPNIKEMSKDRWDIRDITEYDPIKEGKQEIRDSDNKWWDV